MVETKIPPMIAIAIGILVSPPGPMDRAGGMAAAIVEIEVIRIGRSLTGQAFRIASFASIPFARSWFVKSTRIIEFFFTSPMSRISAIKL